MTKQLRRLFRRLSRRSYKVKSCRTLNYDCSPYNCIAWALGRNDAWWDPHAVHGYWPDGIPRESTINALVQVFQAAGFQLCDDRALEKGFEKIAIYGRGAEYTHAARQLPDGTWASKIGYLQDIVHATLEVLTGAEYGSVVRILKRPR
jgi:hypothetical protein